MKSDWRTKLTPFDFELCKMVALLTERPCRPKNGGTHYYIEPDYEQYSDNPEFLLSIWDAIEGRAGKRLISMKDDAGRHVFVVRIKFHKDECPDAAFVPKIEQE